MRIPNLRDDEITDAQRQARSAIDEGPRSKIPGRTPNPAGPFNILIRRPELADCVQKLGLYVRLGSSLPPRLVEFAVIIAARHWDAQYVWVAHRKHALRGGLAPQVADDLGQGRKPAGMQADEAVLYDFCTELQATHGVNDANYAAAVARFGIDGVLDIIAAYGYYSMISMFLNVNQSMPKDGPLMAISPRP